MTRWAASSPRVLKRHVCSLSVLGAASILIGCGGGGGGGVIGPPPGLQACGSAANSVVVVLCGKVVTDLSGVAVSGAVVSVRDNAGTVLGSATTNAAGAYLFNPAPPGATQFTVDPPAATFHQNLARFGGGLYYYLNDKTIPAQGKCYPSALPPGAASLPAHDTKLGDVAVFPNSSPPPPAFGCPR